MPAFELGRAALAPALVNRVLEQENWAQTSLATHAGRTFAIVVGPMTTRLRIDAAGKVEAALRDGSPPDLTLALSPFSLPAFLAHPRRWDEFVVADGDPALAATLKGLAETLPWFVERAFATALGPIAGQRLADAGRRLLALPEYAATRVTDSVTSYARDELKFAATSIDARTFATDIEAIASRVDAIEARLDALAARLKPHVASRAPRKLRNAGSPGPRTS
jgi:ubiquinone biosynthesis protein UbiJ